MEVTVCRELLVNKPNSKRVMMTKSFESEAIPHQGDFVQDSMFVDPDKIEVVSTTINYEKNTVSVLLKPIEIQYATDEHIGNLVRIYDAHDWKNDLKED